MIVSYAFIISLLIGCLIIDVVYALHTTRLLLSRRSSSLSLRLKMVEKSLSSGKVLIVQNKGGGHGTIGYQLCKEIKAIAPNVEIAILQDKCNYAKPPFSSYKELESLGVSIIEAKLSSETVTLPDAISQFQPTYVVDNWSKSSSNATFITNLAKSDAIKQVLFVSSAGMYKSSNSIPVIETDSTKTNDPRQVELEYIKSGIPYTFMRPQYIYGPKSSKRYLDYFIGRIHRDYPVPLPMSSDQLVCLTHIEDVASLIATSLGHPKAMNEVFNCGTDRYVTYKGICQLIHKTLGNGEDKQKFLFYDPKEFAHWDSGLQFPFRRETFITSPSKAKLLLGWKPKHSFDDDIKIEVNDYINSDSGSQVWTVDDVKHDLELILSKDVNFTFDFPFIDEARNEADRIQREKESKITSSP